MRRAVVLAGGGARGAYQIGVWKALRELGVGYSIVTGASVGAINAALMVQDCYDLAEEMWLTLSTDRILPLRPGRGSLTRLEGNKLIELAGDLARYGGADFSMLEEILLGIVDEEAIRRSPLELGFITTRFPHFQPVELWKRQVASGQLINYLLASMTYFPVFRMREIDNSRYVDGAYTDNMPARLALSRGAEELILVDLCSSGILHKLSDDIPVTYIVSNWRLGLALHFDPENSRRNLKLGYLDTLRAYQRLEGELYAFQRGETRRNANVLLPALRRLHSKSGVGLPFRDAPLPWPHTQGRKRREFVLGCEARHWSLGVAVTSAAELAGMLLELPPDEAYTFNRFNDGLLSRRNHPYGSKSAARRDLFELFQAIHALLKQAAETGKPSDALFTLALANNEAFYAAYYLTALESQ